MLIASGVVVAARRAVGRDAWSATQSGRRHRFGDGVGPMTVFDDGSGAGALAGGSVLHRRRGDAQRHRAVGRERRGRRSARGLGRSRVRARGVRRRQRDPRSTPAELLHGRRRRAADTSRSGTARAGRRSAADSNDHRVSRSTVFDDGSGPALYVGGFFTTRAAQSANRIAKWDGASWSALGSGIERRRVTRSTVFDDGRDARSTPAATSRPPAASQREPHREVGRLDVVGARQRASTARVDALAVFDDGSGRRALRRRRLHDRRRRAGEPRREVGRHRLGRALGERVLGTATSCALAVFDDGSGAGALRRRRLHHRRRRERRTDREVGRIERGRRSAAGLDDRIRRAPRACSTTAPTARPISTSAATSPSARRRAAVLAQWPAVRRATRTASATASIRSSRRLCPCGNFGGRGRGCANSNAALGGARLIGVGHDEPEHARLHVRRDPEQHLRTFLRAQRDRRRAASCSATGSSASNGTGIRFGSQNAGQGGNPPNTVASGAGDGRGRQHALLPAALPQPERRLLPARGDSTSATAIA